MRNNNLNETELVTLAGLLHDIGKLRQRCKDSKSIDEYNYGFAKKDNRYIHAAHTAQAIDEIGFNDFKDLSVTAASHHKDDLLGFEKIIQEADHLSSSERKERDESDNFKRSKLLSIFSEISLSTTPEKFYFDVQSFNENITMPDEVKEYKSQDIAMEKYEKLYDSFVSDVKEANLSFSNSFQDFLTLKTILEKYTTFVPSSSYKTYPDVSLFDHMHSTAAIATALYKSEKKDKFILIQGDFTSIQNFIFSKSGESNKYMGKILRAKSFFVTIATETIALKICKELGLTPLSIIMNGGGKFTILSPSTPSVYKILEDIRDNVNREFAKINYLQTKFVITFVEDNFENLAYGKCSEVFKKLALQFERDKLKIDPGIDVFDDYIDNLKGKNLCESCGVVPQISPDKELCIYCDKFRKIGERLSKAKYVEIDLNKGIFEGINLSDQITHSECIYYSLDETQNYAVKRISNYLPVFSEKDINDKRYSLIEEKIESIKAGDVKSFYHIAVEGLKHKEDAFYGRKYLAILKADIDNLGQIFVNGFKNGSTDNSTISRIVSLSRLTDFFFTTLLKKRIREKYPNVYTVFAGGDDLFLIGHYSDIVNLQGEIIDMFNNFTKNEDFHMSYAIRLTNVNVPIVQMADFAEEDLDLAKKDEKNATVVFGIKVKNSDLKVIVNKKEYFNNLLAKGVSSQILYRQYKFIEMNEKLKTNQITNETLLRNVRWRALFRYMLERMFESSDDIKLKEEVAYCSTLIDKYGEKLFIPLNLALYEQRKYNYKE